MKGKEMSTPKCGAPLSLLPYLFWPPLYNTKVGFTLKVYEYIYRGVRILGLGKI